MKPALTAMALAALLNVTLGSIAQQQSPVPDAPTPQAAPLSEIKDQITPGIGTKPAAPGASTPQAPPATSQSTSEEPPAGQAPSSLPPTQEGKDDFQTTAPEQPEPGQGFEKIRTTIRLNVNFVEVPVTVKDDKGKLVPGLTYRDFKVYENGVREPLHLFTVDPFPLSIAFVIDQGLTTDVMAKVNDSLDAIQGALTPYDEAAVFTYDHMTDEKTGFTGAQSNRLPAVLALTKATGTEMMQPVSPGGPFGSCSIMVSGGCADPNIQRGGSAGPTGGMAMPEKEIHTLNDAILAAAKELASRPQGRRRIIYVISDGKEYGSKAKLSEVIRYLETNKIAVYGTAVGDSARWGEGYVSRIHLPLTMYDNILAKYTLATGGTLDSERNLNGIEKSYAKIAEEARTQYTLGYLSHQPFIDGKFRKIEVRVNRPNVEVISKTGYYPSGQDVK